MSESPPDRAWWKEAVVYQVYPKSFSDTDGDGVGDLRGVLEKVDYLDELGVDVVWLNPVYDSPQADNGYDIADYRAIDPTFGTMADWEELRDALHDRDIRLIMDLVVNHTSDEHEWFERSRASDPEYADFYHWVEGDPEEPPNNWESLFGGPAWTWDEEREAWYLHLFDEKQPDLNWRNPAVREAVYDMMNWWLERGIDGFRMDVINLVSKAAGYPDGSGEGNWSTGAEHFLSGPRVHEFISEMVEATLADTDAMSVGEVLGVTAETAPQFVGEDGDGLDMLIHFEHMEVDFGEDGQWSVGEWDLTDLKAVLDRWQDALAEDGWNCLYFENHDQPRVVSRFGSEAHREASATLFATLLFTLQGTPFVYQGQELGMTNASWDREDIRDVLARNAVEEALASGAYEDYERLRPLVEYRSRDNARTPMQWDASEHAGFTDGEPWIQLNADYETVNVAAAREEPDSVWHHYRRLLETREDLLVYGDYEPLAPDHERLWAYTRTLADERAIVFLNVSDSTLTVDPADLGVSLSDSSLSLANYAVDDPTPGGPLTLRPYEARVYRD